MFEFKELDPRATIESQLTTRFKRAGRSALRVIAHHII